MFATLSDLPLIQLMFWNRTGISYDLNAISLYAHGVGPNSDWVMYWTPEGTESLKPHLRSPFVDQMHSLDLSVHPYTFKDDALVYMDTIDQEVQLYVTKGVDGLFTEFPLSTLSLFNLFGSKANFPETNA